MRKESTAMSVPRPRRLPGAITLALGVLLGWGLANLRAPILHAHGGDRSGESVLATGPTMVRFDDGLRVPLAHDAIYYLDYKGGRLLAVVPIYRGGNVGAKLLDNFAERDLVADFKLDLERGPKPHFMMTTGALGEHSDGWSPLYVFESTTSQVAVYRVQQQTVGTVTRPRFDLVEIRSFARGASAPGG
jgi:hypothetical protein